LKLLAAWWAKKDEKLIHDSRGGYSFLVGSDDANSNGIGHGGECRWQERNECYSTHDTMTVTPLLVAAGEQEDFRSIFAWEA
jgi:hypothetical protein